MKQQQIEQIILDIFTNNYGCDEQHLQEAITDGEKLYATFGIFIGFFNKLHNQNWTVEQAWDSQELMTLFLETADFVIESEVKPKSKKYPRTYKSVKSTKGQSFKELNKASVAYKVLQVVSKHNEPLSRKEISRMSNIPLETVTGQIPPLIAMGKVRVCGQTVDQQSGRTVELIEAIR